MANNTLKEEFPEVNQSTIHDLLKAYGNDKYKVANVLREMEDESKSTADKPKVEELRNLFPSIPVKDIQAVLASVNGNVEDAIVPLFGKHEEMQREEERKKEAERKKQRESEARQRRQEETRKQAEHLMDVFGSIPKDTIQQILDQNEGDLEETTTKLLAIVAEQEEVAHAKRRAEQEKRQKEEEKRLKVLALKEQFPEVEENQIVTALTESEWDLKRAIAQVLTATNERLKAEMKQLFTSITEEEIDNALVKGNWTRTKTVQCLNELKFKRELEKARQEKERLERERAEKARREAEEQRALLEEQARKERERLERERLERERIELEKIARDVAEREALERRRAEEEQARLVVEQERLRKEQELRIQQAKLEAERIERERIERERAEQERLERERVEQEQQHKLPNIFEMSTMLGERLENEIAELQTNLDNLDAQVNAEFMAKLQNIIEAQARHGVTPGVVPSPLPKHIDSILAAPQEKPQVDDDRSQHLDPVPATTDKARPDDAIHETPASQQKEAKCQVMLKATPEAVDSGNVITVSFEVVSGKSTASDWIGMFPAGQTHTRNYVTYEWRGKDEQKGSVQFTAPAVYGSYEFCYFYNRTYEILTKSNVIRVAPEIAVTATIDETAKVINVRWNQASGNTYPKPWIGLYEKSQTNNKQYLCWTHANKMEVSVPLPTKPKEYELRFFTNSYHDVARSNTVVIEGEDKLSATIENKILVVKPDLVTVDPATDHVWIGIYPVGQQDNHQWTRYKNVPHPTNDITFKTPLKPGEYEVRLFANKTYDVVKRSNSFVVPPPQ